MIELVNGVEVKCDGDWKECPECDDKQFPLLSWMRYCPCCSVAVDFAFCESSEVKDGC